MLANWIEFWTAGVSTKHEGAGRVLVKFENIASSPDSLSGHKPSWHMYIKSGSCLCKLHQNDFAGDFGGENWWAVSVPQGHWTLIFSR